jgi:Zn finger protein HypA/HybF involved in hydrogenase expression
MHEIGLLHAAVAELTARCDTDAVRQVRVAIGPDVDRAVAEAAWANAAAGTPAEGAVVTWERALNTLCCLDCGGLYPGGRLDRCPRCGGDGLVVDAAPELALEDWA